MNREYNRTGSEKSSRILPGPMMLGWPSHRRATTASCIHGLAPNQKLPEPQTQQQHAEITVSFFKRNSIIAFDKCKLLHLMCVGKERGGVSLCATKPLCCHTSKDTEGR